MRRSRWWFPLGGVALLLVLGAAVPSGAQDASGLDIRLERDTRKRTSVSELGVYYTATVTDRATGQAPKEVYEVYAQATTQAGEQTTAFTCDYSNSLDNRVPPGVYSCTIFVDHGGTWDFVVTVNKVRSNPDEPPVTLATATQPFDLNTTQVFRDESGKVQTSAKTVMLLWLHVIVAGGWLLCVTALAWLAVPALRRRMSSFGLNRLERNLGLLDKLTLSSTAALIGTGVYLMTSETAYDTPWSSSKRDIVFEFPYAKPYFLTLFVKLALYALMLVATVPLLKGAHRGLRSESGLRRKAGRADDRPSLTRATPPPGRDEGTVLTAPVEAPPVVERSTPFVGIAAAVLLVGTLGISLCVTLLKYFHQLIEAT